MSTERLLKQALVISVPFTGDHHILLVPYEGTTRSAEKELTRRVVAWAEKQKEPMKSAAIRQLRHIIYNYAEENVRIRVVNGLAYIGGKTFGFLGYRGDEYTILEQETK